MAKEEDEQLMEWIKELDTIRIQRESIKSEVDSITAELNTIKEQKATLESRIAAEEAAAKAEAEAAATAAAVASAATATAAAIATSPQPSTSNEPNAPSSPPNSDSPSTSYIASPLTNSAELIRAQQPEVDSSSELGERSRKKGSVIIHSDDDSGSTPSSPSGSLIVKQHEGEDHSLGAAVQSMEKHVKSPSNKEKERAERERKRAEDKEKRKSGSHGHSVWFGFKQTQQDIIQHDADKEKALDKGPVTAANATHTRSPSGGGLADKKKKSHSRSFSLGISNVFMKPTSPLVNRDTNTKAEGSEEEAKQKEKTTIAKWFGGDKTEKADDKKAKKKNKKGSKTDVREEEPEDGPFAGVPFHNFGSPGHRKSVTLPSSPLVTTAQPLATVSVSEPALGPSEAVDEIVRPSSPPPVPPSSSAPAPSISLNQLRVCIKIESESDDDYTNLYVDKDKPTLAGLRDKVAAKYGKQATQIDWVKMKNTRGRFVIITEEDVSNLETDQELIVRFV
eukprot:TRINITY_DN4932_c0_g1_i1.p1 TRINITY_DN4932_c0_g1~~TRINITY_DN4932_c0_g1_i1.p1  ORF type:complete len:507 (-),score=155.91 TRINITY_DN4932_c0_g1_i1:198-1718(-)